MCGKTGSSLPQAKQAHNVSWSSSMAVEAAPQTGCTIRELLCSFPQQTCIHLNASNSTPPLVSIYGTVYALGTETLDTRRDTASGRRTLRPLQGNPHKIELVCSME